MAVASPQDVAERFGRDLTTDETTQVEALLNDVEAILNTRVSVDDLDPALVIMVECAAVLRVIRNADGIRSESIGEYSISFDRDAASGALTILPREWTLLGVRRGAFTITPYFEPKRPGLDGWCW